MKTELNELMRKVSERREDIQNNVIARISEPSHVGTCRNPRLDDLLKQRVTVSADDGTSLHLPFVTQCATEPRLQPLELVNDCRVGGWCVEYSDLRVVTISELGKVVEFTFPLYLVMYDCTRQRDKLFMC